MISRPCTQPLQHCVQEVNRDAVNTQSPQSPKVAPINSGVYRGADDQFHYHHVVRL